MLRRKSDYKMKLESILFLMMFTKTFGSYLYDVHKLFYVFTILQLKTNAGQNHAIISSFPNPFWPLSILKITVINIHRDMKKWRSTGKM